ncbi:MAG: helix-turn-helix domain-containing protein [Robiginitomaculum sp.]|nr:helix-turn-helix domain-containing protein [Robiginitomaculum sp.]
MSDIWTIKDVASYLKLTEKTAYRLVAEGEIPGFKVGGSWRFSKDEVEKWVTEQAKKNKKFLRESPK